MEPTVDARTEVRGWPLPPRVDEDTDFWKKLDEVDNKARQQRQYEQELQEAARGRGLYLHQYKLHAMAHAPRRKVVRPRNTFVPIQPDVLRRLYWSKGGSVSTVARRTGYSEGYIYDALVRYGIPRRGQGGDQRSRA